MDYQALAQVLPVAPHQWALPHVCQWLDFVQLKQLKAPFGTYSTIQRTIRSMDQPSPT